MIPKKAKAPRASCASGTMIPDYINPGTERSSTWKPGTAARTRSVAHVHCSGTDAVHAGATACLRNRCRSGRTASGLAGTGTPTVTFKQDGEKVTGHYSSMLVGEADLTGTIKGDKIEFTVRADLGGMPLDFTFRGTVENKDSMKGTLDTGGLGNATFTGKRKESK